MRNLSRRSFLCSIGGEAARVVSVAAGDMGLSNLKPPSAQERGPVEIPMGRVSDYPPGAVRSFQAGVLEVEARAFPEGVRALKKGDGSCIPISIRMSEDGNLIAQLNDACSEQEVFSLFSGKMKLP